MKKIFSFLLVMFVVLGIAGCSNNTNETNNDKQENTIRETEDSTSQEENTVQSNDSILVAYYSYSGNTKEVAMEIQKQTGGDIAEISRKEDYPQDFYDVAEQEILDGAQPEINISIDNIDKYEVIFVGYPIWWEEAPAMINTFVHQFDFDGKTVIPFCTSSSDGIEESLDVFDDIQNKATVKEGLRVTDNSEISDWLKRELQ